MAKAPRKKLYRVELFVEVTASISSPENWDWDLIVNGPRHYENKTPVQFVVSTPVEVGNA